MAAGRSKKPRRRSGGGVSLDISGDKELIEALSKVAVGVRTKVLRSAMHRGMDVVTAAVRARTPRAGTVQVVGKDGRPRTYIRTGRMLMSWRTANGKTNSKWKVRVDTRSGRGDYKGKSFYAAFYEFGTKRQPPRPILTPSFDSNKAKALAIARAEILQGIEREIWWASFRKTSLGRLFTGATKRYRSASEAAGKARKSAARSAKRLRKRASKAVARTTRRTSRAATAAKRSVRKRAKALNKAAPRLVKQARRKLRSAEQSLARGQKAATKRASKAFKPRRRRRR